MGKRNKRLDIPDSLFWDASYLIAYFAIDDQYHQRALKIRKCLEKKPIRLVTSWPAVSEASTLLLYHYGYSFAAALLKALSAFELLMPLQAEYEEATTLFKEFNKDQKLSFNDILTYTLIRNRLKNMPILTFDKDFSKIGLTLFIP